ncbi:TIGR03885 family FMN-dependent LLM class oxidoreductase [Parapedobacter deserti]|uniref:TIGR03885 family FMN-dependent LLM class oxidoreductase n=1 Tax=Parapedobacter deserti TaxID=1912957 RepID=A0ABV7JSB3_9SPHI
MSQIAFHASHEQFSPSTLLRYVSLAKEANFDAIHSSDHFQPWTERQGESGHAFSWLGAAMHASALPFGLICAPGPRHHPAVAAQAIATLAELFPRRLWVALGSGEAVNERITGQPWPGKAVRNERLLECFHIIRKLLDGETVTHHGHVCVEEARLYTLPPERPLLLGAAITKETASWMGSWAEGLLTINQPIDKLQEVIEQFRNGGGKDKPIYVKVQLSYSRSESEAHSGALHQWRTNVFDSDVLAELWKPEQFDAIGAFVKPEDLQQTINISSNLQQHVDWLKSYLLLGVDCLILHNVNREQEVFIDDFGKFVLPQLR